MTDYSHSSSAKSMDNSGSSERMLLEQIVRENPAPEAERRYLISLLPSEKARLDKLYPKRGLTRIVRQLVRRHLLSMEKTNEQNSR